MGLRVLSLFDGISAGQVALERAGIEVDVYYASEIEQKAIDTTMLNYPNTIQLGDVTKWRDWDLGHIDLLIGGSPCQGFSYAGKQLNFNDPRSKLFFEYVDILNHYKPKYFLLENVRMKSKFEEVVNEKLGVKPHRINSRLKSAQLRERLYWTNIKFDGDLSGKNVLLKDVLTKGYTERDKSRCLLEGDSRPNVTPHKMFHRYKGTGFATIIFKDENHYNECLSHWKKHFKGKSALEIDDYLKNNKVDISVYEGLRHFDQQELEKLQTFPVGYTKHLTRNETASVMGNGWTVDVIAHIFRGMKND